MDTGSRRIRKTVPKSSPRESPVPDVPQSIQVDGDQYSLVDIRATGDVLLDVTFDNQKSSTKLALAQTGLLRSIPLMKAAKPTNTRVLYRVRLDTLKKKSKYFELLLGSDKFEEGKNIAEVFDSLQSRGISPTEANPTDLPRIAITDDDDSTRMAGREVVLGDLLRILHGADGTMRLSIPYLSTLAIMADRFDCNEVIGRYVNSKKFPGPQTFGVMTAVTEEALRQKILVSWLLDDQTKLASATKELILRGSLRWSGDDTVEKDHQAIWWDLQDGLEGELFARRSCILSTLSSLQSHFIGLYTSRERQCKQFYDSSAACDSYQLGEMIKFFTNKGLLSLASILSPDFEDRESYGGDIENVITSLRQCPSYQIDSNHSHCGLRTRIIPALDYIQAMLTSNIGIDRGGWKTDRLNTSWDGIEQGEPFRFTRAIAGDQRFKMEGYLVANKHAKALFTAGAWDWTPEA